MADVNELCDVITREGEETEGDSLSRQHQEDIDDIPPSLLRYFESSKSRAAVCEKLILQEPEDLTSSHDTEDMMNLSIGLDRDTMELNKQVICESENVESNISTDTQLLPAYTEVEAHFNHSVSVCPTSKDGEHDDMESERHFTFDEMTLEMSLNEEERIKSDEYEAEKEKQHCEKMMREEKRRQIERDFQHELTKIMEAEKLHQKELELMEKRAQEKLEQELLLQQELLNSLRRRVEEESRLRAEEQGRIKDEKEKRKREEEEFEKEAKRKQMEEEKKWKEEEQKKIKEMKLKKEEERRKKEEEERKREEERKKRELEKKRREDEMRMMKEEEDRKNKEEEIAKIKKEEEERRRRQKMKEEARRKMEKQRRKMEEEMRLKEEECRKKEEDERKNREEENMRMEEEQRRTKETERVKKEEERRKKKKEEEAGDQKRMNEEMRRRDERGQRNEDEEREREKRTEQDGTHEEEEGETKEKEGRKMEEKKEVKEVVKKYEGENKNMKEERRPKSEQEVRLKEDKEGHKDYDVDNRETEQQRETGDKEKKEEEEEKSKKEEEKENVEKEQNKKEVEEKAKDVNNRKKEEIRLVDNELQDKRDDSVIGQNETNDADETEISLTSKQQDCTTWTSSGPDPLHSESTTSPCRTEDTPQQHEPDTNISQTSMGKTVDCENQAAAPSAVSAFLPLSLPEHTELKRLSWMKDCVSWSKLSLQNRRKQRDTVRSRREPRRFAEASCLPPLCADLVLQSGWKSLQQVTTVTLEDLPGCSLSTLSQCTQLRSLSLRRCGLKSLDGINQLPQLCYIDVQENDISFVNCENMTTLRVLRLGRNKLTSIHGLRGAENLDVLDLSHNSITRIAGLESVRRLQRLSLDHNQLISTKALRDVYTLLHLSCSHNHLTSVEGLENSALLNTLDLRANSLTEAPSLTNHVLLRELHLDDNSISSLQGLAACWLPLMQHLSVAQNRITQLPSMSDLISLANLDLRFNCMSELQNLCESLQECWFMREIHLAGNPLQQEGGWRSSLQKALPSLRAIDEQDTDSFLSPPTVQQVSLASGGFLTFCQAQLQQAHDLQQQHSRELSNASGPLDSLRTSCRHFSEALQVAVDQRFAHEYGDTTVVDKDRAAGQTVHEETLDVDSTNAEKCAEPKEIESTGKVPPVIPERNDIRCSLWTFEEMSAARSPLDTVDTATAGPQMEPAVCKVNSSSVQFSSVSSDPEMPPVSNHQDLDLQNTAAFVIQQRWKKHRQRCGSLSAAERGGGRGGDEGQPESGPFYINRSVVGQDYAATVIQAFWRGFTLRRRLASALAAVTCPSAGEDDTFEEVDVDEFVFDEAALEEDWTLLLSEDSPPRRYPVSEQPLDLKPSGSTSEPSQDHPILSPPPVWRSKQAWVSGEQVDSAGQRVSPVSSGRGKSPVPAAELSGLSSRSEKILEEWGFTHSHTALLMLKRAQKMKSKKHPQRKCRVREAELGLQQADKTERVKEERAQEWLHVQTAHPDRDSESVRFLPEISSDILNGGRVQLVAGPGYTERLHHASGLWANSSLAGQPCKENNYPRRNSLGHAREEIPSPRQVTSAPSKKERISFRDNPVHLSGGWGGGKKRGKVFK